MGRRRVLSVAFIGGLCGIIAQVLIIRELMVVFFGNELTMGTVLGSWLVWTGIGSFTLGRLAGRFERTLRWLGIAFVALALIAPATILLAESLGRYCGLSISELVYGITSLGSLLKSASLEPGEIPGLSPILLYSATLLMPLCLLNGFIFPACCRLRGEDVGVGEVYVFEALGAGAGGFLFTVLFIRILEPLSCAGLIGLLYAVGAVLLERRISGVVAGVCTILLASFAPRLSPVLRADRYIPNELLFSKDSVYGRISTVRTKEGQFSLYSNGILAFTYPDRLSAEEMVHIPMNEHPEPRRVLVLGGALGGALEELLKYRVDEVVYVELDPLVVEAVKEVFPRSAVRALVDRRVRVINQDARLYLKKSKKKFDMIIQNLPEPSTAQLNRFYTVEHFKGVRSRLKEPGVFAFSVRSSTAYQGRELSLFLSSIRDSLLDAFEEVIALPGESCIFLASSKKRTLTTEVSVITQRLEARNVETEFVTPYDLPFTRFHPFNLERLRKRMDEFKGGKRNRDLSPRCYIYDLLLWWKMYRRGLQRKEKFTNAMLSMEWWHLAFVVMAVVLAVGLCGLFTRRGLGVIPGCVATVGFAEIGVEFIALLGFQVIYGYAYQLIAGVLSSFMVGLTAGGLLISRRLRKAEGRVWQLMAIQSAVAVYPMILAGTLVLLSRVGVQHWLVASAVFCVCAFLAGFVGGLQFPLATNLFGGLELAGTTYAWDLAGSCTGVIFISIIVVPVIGLVGACVFLAVLNALTIPLLLLVRTEE